MLYSTDVRQSSQSPVLRALDQRRGQGTSDCAYQDCPSMSREHVQRLIDPAKEPQPCIGHESDGEAVGRARERGPHRQRPRHEPRGNGQRRYRKHQFIDHAFPRKPRPGIRIVRRRWQHVRCREGNAREEQHAGSQGQQYPSRSHRHAGHGLTQSESHQRNPPKRFKRRHSPTHPSGQLREILAPAGNTSAVRRTGALPAARAPTSDAMATRAVSRAQSWRERDSGAMQAHWFQSWSGPFSSAARNARDARLQRNLTAVAAIPSRRAMTSNERPSMFRIHHVARESGRKEIERILQGLQFEVCGAWCELFLELQRSLSTASC